MIGHIGSHAPSSEDLSPFLEGGFSYGGNLFIYERHFTPMLDVCCCNLMLSYDWRDCVANVLGTTKHS